MVEDIFRIGSTAGGALLYGAVGYFEKGSPRADEIMRALRSEGPQHLALAVDSCIAAASYEFSTVLQRRLLKVGLLV